MTATEPLTDTERLVAIEEIKALKARRVRALDTRDWTTYEELHHPDYEANNEGDVPRKGIKQTVAYLAEYNKHITTLHHAHTPEITIHSHESASGVWAMEDRLWWQQGDEDHWFQGFGFYYETYEKLDGRWVFKTRRLERLKIMMSPGAEIGTYRDTRGK